MKKSCRSGLSFLLLGAASWGCRGGRSLGRANPRVEILAALFLSVGPCHLRANSAASISVCEERRRRRIARSFASVRANRHNVQAHALSPEHDTASATLPETGRQGILQGKQRRLHGHNQPTRQIQPRLEQDTDICLSSIRDQQQRGACEEAEALQQVGGELTGNS